MERVRVICREPVFLAVMIWDMAVTLMETVMVSLVMAVVVLRLPATRHEAVLRSSRAAIHTVITVSTVTSQSYVASSSSKL